MTDRGPARQRRRGPGSDLRGPDAERWTASEPAFLLPARGDPTSAPAPKHDHTRGLMMSIPSADSSYSFAFDGRIWTCRDTIPAALWHDFDVLVRQPNLRPTRRVRRRATQIGAKVLRAVVIGVDELLDRARRDPELYRDLVEVVLPDLLNHYGMPLLAGRDDWLEREAR